MAEAALSAMGLALSLASTGCFGLAMITSRIGLQRLDARSGAATSVPTAAVVLALVAPWLVDWGGWDWRAAGVFAAVGLLFPAVVTMLTFRANQLLGPTLTSAASATSPLFAIAAAAVVLHEQVPPRAAFAAAAVVLGVAWLSAGGGLAHARARAPLLLWPLAASAVRGGSQVGAKLGLALWPDPWVAVLIGYAVSAAVVTLASGWRRAPVAEVMTAGRQRLWRRLPWSRPASGWFAATGVLNGTALLLLYAALGHAPVWVVAPIVAAYPVLTAVLGAWLLPDERLNAHRVGGLLLTVGAVVWLVSGHAG